MLGWKMAALKSFKFWFTPIRASSKQEKLSSLTHWIVEQLNLFAQTQPEKRIKTTIGVANIVKSVSLVQ